MKIIWGRVKTITITGIIILIVMWGFIYFAKITILIVGIIILIIVLMTLIMNIKNNIKKVL
jgi:hypothetical protein